LRALALLSVLTFSLSATADDTIRGALARGAQATVIEVVDGDTVILKPPPANAAEVRLVGIQAPKLPLGRKGFKAWPLSAASKRHLEKLVLNRRVTLYFGGTRMDRHGRHLAHLFRDDGTWVQGHMLADGMARVYSFADNRAVVPAMLGRERAARKARRGIWVHPYYGIRDTEPANLMRRLGTFQIIEGTVLDAARVKSRVYLNFGADWRSDFTVTLDRKTRRLFDQSGMDPLTFKDKRLRVRGWLRKRNGPMIEASHPEQFEILPTK